MRTLRRWWAGLLMGCGLASSGCVGSIGDAPAGGDESASVQDGLCADGSIDVAVAPMRRLTRREYNHAIRDLLGDDSGPADSFVPDESMAGFSANSIAPITKLQIQDYITAAELLAERVANETHAEVVGCDLAQTECAASFITSFGRRAFRRPVPAEVEAELLSVYSSSKAEWGAPKAFELLVQSILLSPYFLYHVELSLPEDGDTSVALLDGFELASRLSFFLWQTVPDDELLAAAEAGDLSTREGIAQQAERMIADARARDGVEAFIGQWLEVEELGELLKSEDAFPLWSPTLAEAMERETLAFADHVMREGGTLPELLTASYTYADASLAELYGADPPEDAFGRIELDPAERAGLLTHGSFLASRAHATEASWVFRGKFVRERLLCDPLPPPPPGVDMNQSNDPDRLENPECKGCHVRMDPIGLGFEQYDAIGQFQAESEVAVGEIIEGGAISGEFAGPVELGAILAESDVVRECFAKFVFRYAARRAESDEDDCSIESVDAQFAESDSSLSALLIAITTSDAFRYRKVAE